jgi:hypothetical protein
MGMEVIVVLTNSLGTKQTSAMSWFTGINGIAATSELPILDSAVWYFIAKMRKI